MSNSDPSAIVLQGIPCIGGLYTTFDSNRENGSLKVCRDSPLSRSRMRSRTSLASSVENEACRIAKYHRLCVHRHEARMKYEVSPRAIAVPAMLSQDPDQLLLAAS